MKALNSLNFPKKMKETKMREEGGRGSYFVLENQNHSCVFLVLIRKQQLPRGKGIWLEKKEGN